MRSFVLITIFCCSPFSIRSLTALIAIQTTPLSIQPVPQQTGQGRHPLQGVRWGCSQNRDYQE